MRISDWSSDVCSSDLALRDTSTGSIAGAGAGAASPSALARFSTACRLFPPFAITPPPLHCRSEEHTSELQSLMRISYAVFCLKKKNFPKTKQRSINRRHEPYAIPDYVKHRQ